MQDENHEVAVADKGVKKAVKGTTKTKAAAGSASCQAESQQQADPGEGQLGNGRTGPEDIKVQQFKLPLEDLVARFTQATNELQLLGVVKADIRKKRGQYAQRLVWATALGH